MSEKEEDFYEELRGIIIPLSHFAKKNRGPQSTEGEKEIETIKEQIKKRISKEGFTI